MKNSVFVRCISFVIVILMLAAVFSACAKKDDVDTNKNDNVNKDTVASTSGDGDGTESETVPDITPLDWDGREYRILGRQSSTPWATNWEVWRETVPEDAVGKAVWQRNQNILEKYNIYVKGYLETSTVNVANTMFASGEDLYDLTIMFPENHHPFAIKGYLIDLYNLDYINMDHEGWMPYPNKQLTMGGKLFYTTNKFLVQDKNRCWCVFYNRDLAKELNLGYFEDWVFDGTWTIDKVIELGKQATYESDGQPGMGLNDNWGVGAPSAYELCALFFGGGFRLTEHGNDGYPKLIGATDRIMQILDKCYALRGNTEVLYTDIDYGSTNWDDCIGTSFQRGTVCMLFEPFSDIDTIKSKGNFELGVLPNPKSDVSQEAYYTIPNLGNGCLFSVPYTVEDREFAGYALEAITEESVDTSYRVFIEEKSMLQNASDEDCAACMRILFDGVVYDIGFVSDIGGLGQLAKKSMGVSTFNNYARLFGRIEGSAEQMLQRVRDAYAAMDS